MHHHHHASRRRYLLLFRCFIVVAVVTLRSTVAFSWGQPLLRRSNDMSTTRWTTKTTTTTITSIGGFATTLRRQQQQQQSLLFVCSKLKSPISSVRSYSTLLHAQQTPQQKQQSSPKLSTLPVGISPFEKGLSKSLDIQGELRKRALQSVQQAMADGIRCIEMEFPPLLGGQRSASQFDDFDNIQELNQNRDWCAQFVPLLLLALKNKNKSIWLIFGDEKECQLAQQEWSGQRFQQAAKFTYIEAVTKLYTSKSSSSSLSSKSDESTSYSAPWGAAFATSMSNLLGGGDDGGKDKEDDASQNLLPNKYASTSASASSATAAASVHLVCQPGNGGPVEDWINTQVLHSNAWNPNVVTIVVNGALDKVRDGYYPSLVFPKLAKTVSFYQSFTAALFLKPIYEQGVYGWIYRQYPEPWQVILQTKSNDADDNSSFNRKNGGGQQRRQVEERVALVSERRPSYREAVQALVQASRESNNS